MWCLFRFLPILIGDKVDVEKEEWRWLWTLWNIVQLCTAPAIKKDDVPYLRVLIEEHHTLFKGLYPAASIIPKMHYVIHIPDDIPGDYEFIISFLFVSCSVVSVNFACSPSNYNVN